jgi:hypothetical protein
MKVNIFTTMTDPEKRRDPWREALNCYQDFADEVTVVGQDWPYEFNFKIIGQYFQEGFDKSNCDWAFRMDIDYFLHEKNFKNIYKQLDKYSSFPAIVFPQYQFFTSDRYQIKTKLAIALNKKKFPQIKFNGGGDLCLPTLENKLLDIKKLPNLNIPIFQYDSMFRTKEIISEDRARFARGWKRTFGDYGDRGGPTPEEAFESWFNMIEEKYKFHTHKINIKNHPKYIKNRLLNLSPEMFGHTAFELQTKSKRPMVNYIKGYKEKYLNNRLRLIN